MGRAMGKSSQRKGRAGELELCRILQAHGYPVERLNVPEAMAQAERDARRFGDGAPAVFHRRSRSPWLVTMKLEDWMEIYQGRADKYE